MRRAARPCLLVWIEQGKTRTKAFASKTAARRAVEDMRPRPQYIIADNGTFEEFSALEAKFNEGVSEI